MNTIVQVEGLRKTYGTTIAVDEISFEANSGDYDLIVIGAHQQNWQRFLLDDLSCKIIERAEHPVLVVK